MFFLWFSRSWSPYWSFSSFSGAGQTNNAEGSFFLTFRSNREIFFCCSFFFRLRGMGGGNERYSFNYFFERKHHLFSIVFQTYNWCSESYRIGLAFRDAVFLRFGFFSLSSMIFFSQSDLFLFAFFVFSLFFSWKRSMQKLQPTFSRDFFSRAEMMMRWRIWYM